ncbi:ferredoxin reductase [Microbispora siamensis]|uniref:Oxidoreductase n=1 Tax=Microbispora siamensis TaxID=564413 RepID=A0ABQ4GX80_9ACTN|nr:ferredoxin reductase [Microbispora siamensis]GIH66034.1 oxidoreductase [Microbispora siamensis]
MTRWRAARLVKVRDENPTARTLVFDVPGWPGHLAGQHVDVKLTAEDGYSARRSYSLAGTEGVELTVQRVPDGEVSPYLTLDMEPGDELELRGPVGGWFVWRPDGPAPVLLVAGGAGIVPLMAMIRARRAAGADTPFRLVYAVRSPERLCYADELLRPDPGVSVTLAYTRRAPEGHPRPPGRLTAADLGPYGEADCYVCGPTGFVEAAAALLVGLGHDPARIRTERFGPTGD